MENTAELQKTYESYETAELEGSVFTLGERSWGVTDEARAVYASSLDTCCLVVIYDKKDGTDLLGAIHWRSPKESKGAIGEMAGKLRYQTNDIGVGMIRGRYCSEQSENTSTIREELKDAGLEVPEVTPQGPNGLFLVREKQVQAVSEAPSWVRSEINSYYKKKLLNQTQ